MSIDNPILNSPYDPPERHFELGPAGPTGTILPGRRPSESFIPVPATRKGKGPSGGAGEQSALDFDTTGERRETNTLINDVRREVELWRARGYKGVTPYTRKLLQHWAPGPHRDDPVLFCQREAAETAIFLAEVAGRHGTADYRRRLEPENRLHNDDLPRVALKMATGTGKTVVMAMLIAWQAINKVHAPRDARFAKQFLVVTPGITIRDRLRVLQPGAHRDDNYYLQRDLVPPDLMGALLQAQVVITNYHAFLLRDAKEIQGVAATTRKILNAGKRIDPFKETEDQMVARVLADFGGRGTGQGKGRGEIVVFNDEAHHCYQDKLLEDSPDAAVADKEDRDRNADARVWFRGLHAVRRTAGIKTVYDLSATPYYLKGSGWNEGYIFPWTVSDFSLMDAIESGIVKVPRIPVDDDAGGEQVTYLHLWDAVGKKLPKRKGKRAESDGGWVPPKALEGALESLYRSYEQAYRRWERHLEALGEPPPVFIVVCPNTIVSKLVFDWIAGAEIAGAEVEGPDGKTRLRAGRLPLLSNVGEDGEWIRRSPTVLIDSAQLESGEAMKDDFKAAAAAEIEHFKRELVERGDTATAERLTDEDLLREVMNTVGKRGRLGEQVRCVVSVGMLTEGWDANTVTHILGIRAFRSQLLCEQVVGRGLRRRDWSLNAEGRFEPEYADIYGVPFAFIPGDGRSDPDGPPRPPAVMVQALADRRDLRITFPKLDGYRVELPEERFIVDFDEDSHLRLTPGEVATWVELSGVVGATVEIETDRYRNARPQQIAYQIARTLIERHYQPHPDDRTPWLFEQLVQIAREWLASCVTTDGGTHEGLLLVSEGTNLAAEMIHRGLLRQEGNRAAVLRPILRRFDAEGSTDDVAFPTRKKVWATTRSQVSHVVCDSDWEQGLAEILEGHRDVHSYVKNDHLGFEIPYVHEGRSYDYVPDFLLRLRRRGDGDAPRTLVIEVSGGIKEAHAEAAALREAKFRTARDQWCPAVNNHGGFGRWGYAEVSDMTHAGGVVNDAIATLYADGPVIGDPDPMPADAPARHD
jgi:type III restriction enzyme